MQREIKRVGESGQISVGRELAGKLLRVERLDDGRLVLTPVVDVAEHQLWTLREPDKSRIERGLSWAAVHTPKESNLAKLAAKAKQRRKK